MSTKLINNVIFGKNFCRLCFGDVYDDDLRFHDVVIINLHSEKISNMLTYVLGGKYTNSFTVYDAFCNVCVQSLTNTYNFMRMCKNNSDRLEKTVEALNEALQSAECTEASKSVLIQIDTTDYSFMQFYQYRRFVKDAPPSSLRGDSKHLVNKVPAAHKIVPPSEVVGHSKYPIDFAKRKDKSAVQDKLKNISSAEVKFSLEERQSRLKMLIQKQSHRVNKVPAAYKIVPPSEVVGHSKYLTDFAKRKDKSAVQEKLKNSSNAEVKFSLEERQNRLTIQKQSQKQKSLRDKKDQTLQKDTKPEKKLTRKQRDKLIKLATKKLLSIKTERKKFVCNECGKIFNFRSTIVRHIQNAHSMCQFLVCEYCDDEFKDSSKLKRHIRECHIDIKSVQCDICNAKFKQLESVYRHRKRHFNPGSRLYVENITK